jgi:uncharacterized membrane protein (UPF0127 family)
LKGTKTAGIPALLIVLLLSLLPASCGADEARVIIKGAVLTVEVVDESAERSRGLMYREHLPENRGMLFVYPQPKILSFWMKNTHIPLSVAFIDEEMRIFVVYDMEPLRTDIDYISPGPAKYALEVNRGWFERHGVGVGDVIHIELK